mmetsp:Transcript_20221/g.51680  ORF Transcript_20221/g.51680 Transcript_20221/m.51680 type:complete len:250 (-) Transcript_20221:1748-2497(-)
MLKKDFLISATAQPIPDYNSQKDAYLSHYFLRKRRQSAVEASRRKARSARRATLPPTLTQAGSKTATISSLASAGVQEKEEELLSGWAEDGKDDFDSAFAVGASPGLSHTAPASGGARFDEEKMMWVHDDDEEVDWGSDTSSGSEKGEQAKKERAMHDERPPAAFCIGSDFERQCRTAALTHMQDMNEWERKRAVSHLQHPHRRQSAPTLTLPTSERPATHEKEAAMAKRLPKGKKFLFFIRTIPSLQH